ncbi:hypothetical protein ACFV1A_26120 [Streptomyces seoulensis]|uniref:hypothetical protein n=1 Tax=Streptomyces seoulensis TaxID=73044 RepID=UPI0036C6BC33
MLPQLRAEDAQEFGGHLRKSELAAMVPQLQAAETLEQVTATPPSNLAAMVPQQPAAETPRFRGRRAGRPGRRNDAAVGGPRSPFEGDVQSARQPEAAMVPQPLATATLCERAQPVTPVDIPMVPQPQTAEALGLDGLPVTDQVAAMEPQSAGCGDTLGYQDDKGAVYEPQWCRSLALRRHQVVDERLLRGVLAVMVPQL